MITRFLLGIEAVRDCINGRREVVIDGRVVMRAEPARGPEILFGGDYIRVIRPVIADILRHTQLPETSIDWIEVVGNWGMPWPKGREPKVGDV